MKKWWLVVPCLLALCFSPGEALCSDLIPTPIERAIARGDTQTVRDLLKANPELVKTSTGGKHGWTLLHLAVAGGHIEIAELFLAKGLDVNVKTKMGGETPLALAARRGNAKMVAFLIDKGAKVNGDGKRDLGPIQGAVISRRAEVVRLLIKKGARLDTQDQHGRTLIHVAVDAQSPEMVKLLAKSGAPLDGKAYKDDFSPLHWAVCGKGVETVEAVLDVGVPVDVRDNKGRTPLHMAATIRETPVMKLLIEKGANVNALDHWGWTPIDHMGGLVKERKLLEAHGGITGKALHQAVDRKDVEAVSQFLDEHPEFINSLSNPGFEAPLHRAVCRRDEKMARLLLERKADVNVQSGGHRKTPLHMAIEHGRLKMAELLLAKGAKVDIANASGHTPLHWAVVNGQTGMVKLLLAKGADVTAKTKDGKTPLAIARDMKREGIADLLSRAAELYR